MSLLLLSTRSIIWLDVIHVILESAQGPNPFFFFLFTFIWLGGLLGPGFGPGLDNYFSTGPCHDELWTHDRCIHIWIVEPTVHIFPKWYIKVYIEYLILVSNKPDQKFDRSASLCCSGAMCMCWEWICSNIVLQYEIVIVVLKWCSYNI